MARGAAAAAALCLVVAPGSPMQDSVKQSIEYVQALDDDCVYDDGYRCVRTSEDDFAGRDPRRAGVPGPYLEAWSTTYRDFLMIPEMTEDQKRLKHYRIGLTENDGHYIILYQGLLLPMLDNGKVSGTMRATYGMSTKYWVDKRTLEIEKRLFLR